MRCSTSVLWIRWMAWGPSVAGCGPKTQHYILPALCAWIGPCGLGIIPSHTLHARIGSWGPSTIPCILGLDIRHLGMFPPCPELWHWLPGTRQHPCLPEFVPGVLAPPLPPMHWDLVLAAPHSPPSFPNWTLGPGTILYYFCVQASGARSSVSPALYQLQIKLYIFDCW